MSEAFVNPWHVETECLKKKRKRYVFIVTFFEAPEDSGMAALRFREAIPYKSLGRAVEASELFTNSKLQAHFNEHDKNFTVLSSSVPQNHMYTQAIIYKEEIL